MKFLMTALLVLSSTQAFAGQRYVCTENNKMDDVAHITLTQAGENPVDDSHRSTFVLQVFKGKSLKAITKEVVNVTIDDVMFKINNRAKKINGIIFFDEMNASWLHVGTADYSMTCKQTK